MADSILLQIAQKMDATLLLSSPVATATSPVATPSAAAAAPVTTSSQPPQPPPPRRPLSWSLDAAAAAVVVPELIQASYVDFLDITKIHEAIQARFNGLLVASTATEAAAVKTTWNIYCQAARPLIDAFLVAEKTTMSNIIRDYLDVAKEYIQIYVIRLQPPLPQPPLPQPPLPPPPLMEERRPEEEQEDHHHLPLVDLLPIVTAAAASSTPPSDDGRSGSIGGGGVKVAPPPAPAASSTYEDLGNFIKRIDAFEGKQRSKPPQAVYQSLSNYLETRYQINCDEIRTRFPLTDDGKKEGTSIAMLCDALYRTRHSNHYKDVEWIAHVLWGWRLADITTDGLRQQLIADYITTQKIYEEIKDPTRVSSLNVNIRLWFHLNARGYECKITDFKSVSSVKSIEYHERMLSTICERTGFKYIPITATS